MRTFKIWLVVAAVAGLTAWMPGDASALPVGWSCTGFCGTSGADGVVTSPPGGGSYEFVSTYAGDDLGSGDLEQGAETNGSILTSSLFSASANDVLTFYFNYITSDGAGFSDYAWARLMDSVGNPVSLDFTARTVVSGDTVPGFGLPPISGTTTLVPASSAIIPGGPTWSPLGVSTGTCYSAGCGYTGWIQAQTIIAGAGNYRLEFGVVNWIDSKFDSGLAIKGTSINEVDIQSVPEPATLLLVGSGLVAAARARRRQRAA